MGQEAIRTARVGDVDGLGWVDGLMGWVDELVWVDGLG